jgi:Ca-activated chloride channel homolog
MSSRSQWTLSLCLSLGLLVVCAAVLAGDPQQGASANPSPLPKPPAPQTAKAAVQRLDLAAATNVDLPASSGDLRAVAFRTSDGKTGWMLRLPGGRPIATPAYADGMLFIGGGYGSHEFYAVDADSGKVIWKMQTGDDGPTAAVVAEGFVAFNTESCTLIVVDEKTGKIVWQEWLGDPLMSQPAIDNGVLYMAYPAGQDGRAHSDKGAALQPAPASPGGSHRLLALDLRNGKHLWEQQISGDVITAPVISEGTVYFTTFDGTSYALQASNGSVLWVKKNAGTSAPVVAGGQLVQTRKVQRGKDAFEGIARSDAKEGNDRDASLLAQDKADYLEKGKGGGVALTPRALKTLDSTVGFAAPPAPAQLAQANEQVGVNSVAGAWAYQGSRAAVSKGQILNAQGRYLNSIRAADGRETWRTEVVGPHVTPGAQVFSPPAVGRDYLYLSAADGHLISVRQSDGALGFLYAMHAPMAFQPALANGNVYAGTSDGRLICLKTGNKDADGWYAWGGNAQHNKIQ